MSIVKILPNDIQAENYVIGVMLGIEAARWIDEVKTILHSSECFYDHRNQMIYAVILDLHSKGVGIDIVTVSDGLSKTGHWSMDDTYLLIEKSNLVTSTANVLAHAFIVKEKYVKRQEIALGLKLQSLGFSEDSDSSDDISEATQAIKDLNGHITKKTATNIKTLIASHQQDISDRLQDSSALLGISSGLSDLDKLTNGWQKGDLIIIGARPSVGKTALTLNFVQQALNEGKAVAVFSLETSCSSILSRMVSAMSGIELYKIKKPKYLGHEFQKYIDFSTKIANFDLSLDDSALLTPSLLRSKVNIMNLELARKGKQLGLIVIDFLQLMRGDKKNFNNREAEISSISRELKVLAMELKIPIIALSQVNRGVESRGGNELFMADLRESGAIEQDASMIIFIYSDEPQENDERKMFLKIAKNKDGEVGIVESIFDKRIQKFRGMEIGYTPTQQIDNPRAGMYPKTFLDSQDVPF